MGEQAVVVRPVCEGDYERVGELIVAAYHDVGETELGGYEDELRAVADRVAAGCVVLVATERGSGPADTILGTVTFVPPGDNRYAEHEAPGAATIRMMAVDPSAQRGGIGERLARACLARADAEGWPIVLHSTPVMKSAHRLYERLGFHRAPEHDTEWDGTEGWGFERAARSPADLRAVRPRAGASE